MDRLGFFKQMFSSTVEVANEVIGIKKAADEAVEAVEEVMRGIKADIGLYLPSLDAAMYDSTSGTLFEVSQRGYTTLEIGSYYDGKCYNVGAEKLKEMMRREKLKISALRINKPYIKPEPQAPEQPTEGAEGAEGAENTEVKVESEAATVAEANVATVADAEVKEPIISESHRAWLEKAIATAKRLGCSYLTMANFPDEPIVEQTERYAEYYNLIGEMCKAKGLMLAIHPTWLALRKQAEGSIFDLVWQKCDKELTSLALDTLECKRGEADIEQLLQENKGRVPVLHLHDYGIVGESEEIDFDKIIALGESCGVKNLYIEVSNFTLPPMNCIERSIYYVESLTSVKF